MASPVPLFDRLFPSIGRKIAVVVALMLALFGGTFVLIAQRTGFSMLGQQAELRALTVSDLMEVMLEHAMLERTPEHLRHALVAAAGTSFVSNAYILGHDGTILFSARQLEEPSGITLEQFQDLGMGGGQKYLPVRERDSLFEYVLVPIVKKPACYSCHKEPVPTQGFFAVKLKVDELRAMASGHRTANIVMTLATFLGLGGVLYLALSLLVVRPIRRLHAHIRTIEREIGQLGKGAQVLFPQFSAPAGRDEIAGLSRDFNFLVERLDVAYAELSDLHHARLEQADRLSSAGQMAAGMAHEIKNPVAGVLGALQVFEAEMPAEDTRREIVGEMKLQLERINRAVNDLLAFARPTPPVLELVSLSGIIERTLALFKPQLQNGRISLALDLKGGDATVLADARQVQQVLWNVMLNAVQAMDSHGTLSIATHRGDTHVSIVVTDSGSGIPPEHASRIFEPFFTTKHKGTGLGMTISKRIMEQHGGGITVISSEGKGTSIRLTIPVAGEGTRHAG